MQDIDQIITDSFFEQENLHRERYNSILSNEFKYAAERLLEESEHEKLETFFSSLGYEILDATEYTFSEQIALFSEATHVAGIAGGGLINSIFCNSNTKITVLSPSNTFYSGGYDHLLSRLFDDFSVAPDKERNYQILEPNRKYSAFEIIEAFSKSLPI